MKVSIFFVVLLILMSYNLFSEENNEKSLYQIYAGIGAGFSNFGVSGSLLLKYNYNSLSFGLRNIKSLEIHLFGKKPNESFSEYSFVVGYKKEYENFSIIYSSGVGLYYYLQRGEIIKGSEVGIPFFILYRKYESEFKSGYCIPFEIQLLPKKKSFSKFGISLFGNLNKDRISYGALLTYNLGKFG